MKSVLPYAPEAVKKASAALFAKFQERRDNVSGDSDVSKLLRLLSKLNPASMAAHPVKTAKKGLAERAINGVLVMVLSIGFLNIPAYADYTLPPDAYVGPAAGITAAQAAAAAAASSSTTMPSGTMDAFLGLGPLSQAGSEETTPEINAASEGRTLYVSTAGSDSAAGAQNTPYKTLQHAINMLQAGDTLIIKEGVYRESADLKASGRADAYITIKGEGNVVINGETLNAYEPIFDTKGFDYLRFENLTVLNSRDAVEVSPGSSYVVVDGLKSDGNDFAVKINGAENVTVRNVYAINSRNAFRTEGTNPRNILFENIETYGSKDIYTGYDPNYTNGDGFILETGTNITLRNIISGDHWDAGFDIKASNVTVENVVAFGNKNNFKTWGTNIVIKSSLSYNAKRQIRPAGGWVDGNGINARQGSVKFINMTFVDNEDYDVKVNTGATIQIQNSILARNINNSGGIMFDEGGTILEENNVWYVEGKTASNAFAVSPRSFSVSSSSKYAEPKFKNWTNRDFRLANGSSALNYGNSSFAISNFDLDGKKRVEGDKVDAGAYEYAEAAAPVPPVISGVAANSITQTGAAIVWTTDKASDSQVQYRVEGAAAWTSTAVNASMVTNHSAALSGLVAGTKYEFRVLSRDASGLLATQTTVSTFTTAGVSNPNPTSCNTAMCGVAVGQEVSGIIKVQPNLTLNPDVRKVSYYLNGTKYPIQYSAPFMLGTTAGSTAGIDTTKLVNGNYTLTGAYTTATGDKNYSIAFTVKNGSVTPDTTAPVISAVASASITQTGAAITWTTNEASDSQVEYRVKGATSWMAATLNALMLTAHSAALTGLTANTEYEFRVKSKDQAGNVATQSTISTLKTLAATAACTTPMCGVTNGQEVSGVIKVQPNLVLNPDVRKVSYYLNGSLVEKNYTAPFTMGGTAGYDTSKLADGTYTLTGAYTTSTGDKQFSITFTVKNTTTTPTIPPVVCSTAICGVSNNQTVNGTINIQPNLTLNPSIRKVSYYLNGTLYERVYTSPFTMGGATGLDTKTLANGTHTISGSYTTASGDVNFTITFKVQN